MPYSIGYALGANGVIYLMISHLGRAYTPNLDVGKRKECLNILLKFFAKESRKHLGIAVRGVQGGVDSQSVETAEMGRIRGYDGAKKIKGRKRHILVDNQGFLMTNVVTTADENDRKGLEKLLAKLSGKGLSLKKNLC